MLRAKGANVNPLRNVIVVSLDGESFVVTPLGVLFIEGFETLIVNLTG